MAAPASAAAQPSLSRAEVAKSNVAVLGDFDDRDPDGMEVAPWEQEDNVAEDGEESAEDNLFKSVQHKRRVTQSRASRRKPPK